MMCGTLSHHQCHNQLIAVLYRLRAATCGGGIQLRKPLAIRGSLALHFSLQLMPQDDAGGGAVSHGPWPLAAPAAQHTSSQGVHKDPAQQ